MAVTPTPPPAPLNAGGHGGPGWDEKDRAVDKRAAIAQQSEKAQREVAESFNFVGRESPMAEMRILLGVFEPRVFPPRGDVEKEFEKHIVEVASTAQDWGQFDKKLLGQACETVLNEEDLKNSYLAHLIKNVGHWLNFCGKRNKQGLLDMNVMEKIADIAEARHHATPIGEGDEAQDFQASVQEAALELFERLPVALRACIDLTPKFRELVHSRVSIQNFSLTEARARVVHKAAFGRLDPAHEWIMGHIDLEECFEMLTHHFHAVRQYYGMRRGDANVEVPKIVNILEFGADERMSQVSNQILAMAEVSQAYFSQDFQEEDGRPENFHQLRNDLGAMLWAFAGINTPIAWGLLTSLVQDVPDFLASFCWSLSADEGGSRPVSGGHAASFLPSAHADGLNGVGIGRASDQHPSQPSSPQNSESNPSS